MVFLKAGEKREIAIGLAAGIISGVASILIASNYIANKASERTIARTMSLQKPRIEENVYSMNSEQKLSPKLTVSITTNEFYNGDWNPVLTHSFYGDTEEELENLVMSHKITDQFFRASFEGVFNWKGSEIKLRNSEPKLLYV